MGSCHIAEALSQREFRLRAFSDFTAKKSEQYSRLIEAQTFVVNGLKIGPGDKWTKPSKGILTNLLYVRYGFNPESKILTDYGYISIIDYMLAVGSSVAAEDREEVESFLDYAAPIYNARGEKVKDIAVGSLIESVKNQYHSIICLDAANAAMASSSIADRITIFKNKITEVFESGFSAATNSMQYFSSLIQKATSVDDYLNILDRDSGITMMANDEHYGDTPANFDIYNYTGCSPAGPLCFNNVWSSITSVWNAGCKIVSNFFTNVWNGFRSWFNNGVSYIHETVIDPYDIYISNKDDAAFPSVSNISYSFKNRTIDTTTSGGTIPSFISDVGPDMVGHTYVMKFIFGEYLFKITKFENNIVTYDCSFKPASITFNAFKTLLNALNTVDRGGDYYFFDFSNRSILQAIPSRIMNSLAVLDRIYCSPDIDGEKEMYSGFCYALTIANIAGQAIVSESFDVPQPIMISTNIPVDIASFREYVTTASNYVSANFGVITNLDFIKAVSGWNGTDFAEPLCVLGDSYSSSPETPLLIALLENLCQEVSTPVDFPFLPYRKDQETFSDSKFKIKTDQENMDAFNKFAQAIIIVTVAVIVSVTAIVAAKKITNSLYMKRVAAKGVLDNKMWNGKSLTKAEKRKYLRLERQLNASSFITSGLLSSDGQTNRSNPFDALYSLIKGD